MALTMRWLPMLFFAFISAQIFSVRQKILSTPFQRWFVADGKKAKRLGQPWPQDRSVQYFVYLLRVVHPWHRRSWFRRYQIFLGLLCVARVDALGEPLRGATVWQSGVARWALPSFLDTSDKRALDASSDISKGSILNGSRRYSIKAPIRSRAKLLWDKYGRIKLSSKIIVRVQPIASQPRSNTVSRGELPQLQGLNLVRRQFSQSFRKYCRGNQPRRLDSPPPKNLHVGSESGLLLAWRKRDTSGSPWRADDLNVYRLFADRRQSPALCLLNGPGPSDVRMRDLVLVQTIDYSARRARRHCLVEPDEKSTRWIK